MSADHTHRYGHRHKQLRAHYEVRLAAGESFTCDKCGLPVTAKSTWDLGHVDGGGAHDWSGPQHRTCNRATAPTGPAAPATGCPAAPPTKHMTCWEPDCPTPSGTLVCPATGRRCTCTAAAA